jgi:hypothetical protein
VAGSAEWAAGLQADSHDPDIRRSIGRAIGDGLVRVRPMPGDPTRVIVFTDYAEALEWLNFPQAT